MRDPVRHWPHPTDNRFLPCDPHSSLIAVAPQRMRRHELDIPNQLRCLPSERQFAACAPAAARAPKVAMRPFPKAVKKTPAASFDHLVGAGEERRWHGEAE